MFPLHPMVVHFPLALLPIAFLADLLASVRRQPAIQSVGWWCLVGGYIGALVSAAAGYSDMLRANLQHETHELVDLHWRTGLTLTFLLTVLFVWRVRRRKWPDA